eukprot:jgi/Picre1/32004/NNA_007352.t1
MVGNGWTPCLEFSDPETAYTGSQNTERMGAVTSGYQDNRYWTMWKLPMFGCTDGSQVLGEMKQCTKAFPNAYIRLVAFDAVRQVQMCGFLVHRPPNCTEYAAKQAAHCLNRHWSPPDSSIVCPRAVILCVAGGEWAGVWCCLQSASLSNAVVIQICAFHVPQNQLRSF